MAVFVFFIISGFLIAQSAHRAPSIAQYFVNRTLRILPGLAVVLVLTALVMGPMLTSSPNYWRFDAIARYLFGVTLFFPSQKLPGVFENLPHPAITNASLWTLHYEAFCYIVLAFLVEAWRRRWASALFLLVVAALVTLTGYFSLTWLLHFGAAFACGSVIYVLRHRISLRSDFAAFCFAIILLTAFFGAFLKVALISFGGYLIIWLALAGQRPAPRSSNHHVDLSYGTYLYAWPTQQILVTLGFLHPFLNALIATPIVLTLAWLSWHFIEYPSVKLKRAFAFGRMEHRRVLQES